jgi:MFS superfamily sulfate permease-like transporter
MSMMKSSPIAIPVQPADHVVDHDDIDLEPTSSYWGSFFPSSLPSLEGGSKRRTYPKKWLCESPMTHHIIPAHRPVSPPVRIQKRRSQSFSDYIEQRQELRQRLPSQGISPPSQLNLLPLNQLIPPQKPFQYPLEQSFLGNSPTTNSTNVALSNPSFISIGSASYHSLQPNESLPDETSDSGQQQQDQSSGILINILYGMINATIVIPVVMSFGNIIYQDSFFGSYAPVLIKLTMVSGVVHQLCFSALSHLPFAVGSVQDAGLIFLSSMATSMVHYCQTNGYGDDDDVILATVTVGLGLASLLLGCGLIVVGKLQLAGYVQMLPTCVVAGYLAYIGFFCGKSGLALMAILDNDTDTDLSLSLLIRQWLYILPGVVGGIFIYWSVRTFRHVAVLPTCILILLLCFYSGLILAQSSVSEATENGWIRKAEQAPVWYRTWDYLQLEKVVWSAFPQLALSEISMLFVVALSSSLDVAAIELELAKPLDYNKELTMVGISNVISGATGGYTGSYIFSQSIFSLRSGIKSRVAGFSLAMCQLLVIVTPVPLLSFVPNCFYGSLLGMISLDLMIEWLWDFRAKVTTAEYAIGLSTFGMIQWFGVEYGILAGVGIYVLCRQLNIPVGDIKLVDDETKKDEGPLTAREEDTDSEKTPLNGDPAWNDAGYSNSR